MGVRNGVQKPQLPHPLERVSPTWFPRASHGMSAAHWANHLIIYFLLMAPFLPDLSTFLLVSSK